MSQLNEEQKFDFCVKAILNHEGGFSDNSNDPGGVTNYGISLRFLNEMGIDINHDGIININDIKEIHFSDAVDIYKKYFWDKYNYATINSLPIATKIFDMAVNIGPYQAHKIVQTSCTYCGHKELTIDGILGSNTINVLNEIVAGGLEFDLINDIINEQKWFYESLVENNPDLKVFLNGWLNRAAYKGT